MIIWLIDDIYSTQQHMMKQRKRRRRSSPYIQLNRRERPIDQKSNGGLCISVVGATATTATGTNYLMVHSTTSVYCLYGPRRRLLSTTTVFCIWLISIPDTFLTESN